MGRRLEYEVKTSVRLNMSNPQHVKINDVIQNLDPKIFKSKNQFIIDAIQFYIDNYGKETFVIKKKEKERAEYIRSEDIDDIKEVPLMDSGYPLRMQSQNILQVCYFWKQIRYSTSVMMEFTRQAAQTITSFDVTDK